MSINSKMTALADEIRELSGTEETMGLDAMTNYVDEANADVATEADLIAQIASALEGKAAGGGSGGDDLVTDTYTVRNNLSCEVYIGGTCIPAGESVSFPASQESISLISIMVKSLDTTIAAYLNSVASAIVLYLSKVKMLGGGEVDMANGISGCLTWLINFKSAPKSGDIIDIGASS